MFNKYTSYQQFQDDLLNIEKELKDKKIQTTNFDFIEGEVLENEKKLNELIESYYQIKETYEILVDKKAVFDKANQLLKIDDGGNFRPTKYRR